MKKNQSVQQTGYLVFKRSSINYYQSFLSHSSGLALKDKQFETPLHNAAYQFSMAFELTSFKEELITIQGLLAAGLYDAVNRIILQHFPIVSSQKKGSFEEKILDIQCILAQDFLDDGQEIVDYHHGLKPLLIDVLQRICSDCDIFDWHLFIDKFDSIMRLINGPFQNYKDELPLVFNSDAVEFSWSRLYDCLCRMHDKHLQIPIADLVSYYKEMMPVLIQFFHALNQFSVYNNKDLFDPSALLLRQIWTNMKADSEKVPCDLKKINWLDSVLSVYLNRVGNDLNTLRDLLHQSYHLLEQKMTLEEKQLQNNFGMTAAFIRALFDSDFRESMVTQSELNAICGTDHWGRTVDFYTNT